jgi:hypothetical protein
MNPRAGAKSVRIETIWNQIWIGGITREGRTTALPGDLYTDVTRQQRPY